MINTISSDIQKFLQKETTEKFLQAAQTFVALLERTDIPEKQFCKLTHTALVDLYAAGQKLEAIELKYSASDYTGAKTDEELFDSKNQNLISVLDEEVDYWQVFDPTFLEGEEPTQGWLEDDFSDIYRDLKIELERIKLGRDEDIEYALWEMHFGFHHHWGNHCINAMRALHYIWYEGKTDK